MMMLFLLIELKEECHQDFWNNLGKGIKKAEKISAFFLYLGWESNPHVRRHWILNPAYLILNFTKYTYNQLINKYLIFIDFI